LHLPSLRALVLLSGIFVDIMPVPT
jgi:hypothetical protein